MKPLKRDRPPRPEGRHVVWLSSSTFELWNDRKQASGFTNNSNSEFAEALLHGFMLSFVDESRSSQRKRARWQGSSAIYSPIPCKCLSVVLPLGYAFRKFYRCKYILMNTRVFRTQVSDPCSFQHREELALSKCYPHCPLAAKILERRAKDKQSIAKPATLPASHPKQLAPTILVKEAPSTKDLVEARLSRFTKKSVSK